MKTHFYVLGLVLLLHSCKNEQRADAYGNFEADETIIASETQGKLIKLNIEEGQLLHIDQIIGVTDTTLLNLNKDQLIAKKASVLSQLTYLQAQVNVQKEQLKVLIKDRKRIENLYHDNAATLQQLDDIEGKVNVLEAQLQSLETQAVTINSEAYVIEKQVKQAQEQINKCTITNPIKGTVLEKYVEQNEVVVPGKAIYKIADLSNIILRVYISGSQLPYLKIGQEIEVSTDKKNNGTQPLKGLVTWISNQSEFTPKIIQTKEERVNLVYAAKIMIKNDGSLKIGMPAEINFIDKQKL